MPVELDAAIDAVARQMTDAEPSGALRARVLEQIQRRPRQSVLPIPRWAWAGAAAAVALAVATAVWVARPVPGPSIPQTTVAEQRPGASSPAVAVDGRQAAPSAAPASQASPVTSRVAAITPRGRGGAARNARPAAADADDLHRLPALAEIEPLRFAAVEPDPLQVEAMELTPFPAIEPLEIPSLDRGPSDTQSVDTKKEK